MFSSTPGWRVSRGLSRATIRLHAANVGLRAEMQLGSAPVKEGEIGLLCAGSVAETCRMTSNFFGVGLILHSSCSKIPPPEISVVRMGGFQS